MRTNDWETVPAAERKKRKTWAGISRIERSTTTGELRFRTHVVWTDENGKRHQSETRVCSSAAECLREAKKLKKQKEAHSRDQTPRQSLSLGTVFEKYYLPALEQRASRVTTEETTGDVNNLRNARALFRHYMPATVKSVKLSEITPSVFGEWLSGINSTDLSGNSVRRYKSTISRFIRYLSDGGYFSDENIDLMIRQRITTVSIKSKAEGARADRVCPSVDDLVQIMEYYRDRGLGEFWNCSWLCLWVILFCGGVRVEELIALRVSSVDLTRGVIRVDDAISDRENPQNVRKRYDGTVKHMKNGGSIREISIMRFYLEPLSIYIERYIEHFGTDTGFLFPRPSTDKANQWQSQKNVLRELERVKKATGISDGIDSQMFRHGCATFLIRDMDLSYDAVHAYFGHTSSEMLRTVYATLNLSERQERANHAMSALLADTSDEIIDPAKQRRQDVMMLRGEWLEWMQDILDEMKKGE